MSCDISIIIPCYNDGKYLWDAINSVRAYEGSYSLEIIVVNDGSRDVFTLGVLDEVKKAGIRVIDQENKGLSGARNTGIGLARGTYILPLDSDNKILSSYVNLGIPLLKKFPRSIVYSDRQHFGDRNDVYLPGAFSIYHQMVQNTIDACAIYPRELWVEVGGYDEHMRKGYEDWEFWVRAYKAGYGFRHINAACFMYRVRMDSMVRETRKTDTHKEVLEYIQKKHFELFSSLYLQLYEHDFELRHSLLTPIKQWFRNIGKRIVPARQNNN